MKNKKWLLLLIIAFPSLFWLILETSTIQSKKLPFYGPKTVNETGDSLFYQVSSSFPLSDSTPTLPPSQNHPEDAWVLSILHPNFRNENYRLQGFWEYLLYKQSKIAQIPFIFLCPLGQDSIHIPTELQEFQKHNNIRFVEWPKATFDSLWKTYYKEKPYYVDFSFFVLIDRQSHIRGYYDMRYASEMKRLIEEYQHLRLKEEKQKLLKNNEIKSNP